MAITAEHVTGYQAGTWKLDPTHSEITFSVRHLAISKVRGSFEQFDVTVTAPENPSDATVAATIEIASVNTKQSQRDQHLRTSDFFAADEHPQMIFASTAFHPEADGTFVLQGDLTLRGVTKPVLPQGRLRRHHGRRLRPDQGRHRGHHEDQPPRLRRQLERGRRGRRHDARRRRHDHVRPAVRPELSTVV